MNSIDFSEPTWLLNYYKAVGITSLFLNCFGLYLIIFETKRLGYFRYYLMITQFASTLTDIHFSFLMEPVPLYPLLSVYTVGVLSSYFNVSAHVCIVICGFVALSQLESLVVCFVEKHQALAIILKNHVIPKPLLLMGYLKNALAPIILGACLQFMYMTREQHLEYIGKTHPQLLPGFKNLTHFVIYLNTPDLLWFYICLLVGGFGMLASFLIFITDIILLMRKLKLRLSSTTFQRHQEAVQSLLVQVFTAMLCLGPPCVLAVMVFIEVSHGQLVSMILIAWFTSHSSVNMVFLCVFFPPYRRFFEKRFIRRSKKKAVIIPSSVIF